MVRGAIGLGCALAGYLLGAFGGGWLVLQLTSNRHDASTEAAMTGAFVLGPIAAVIGLVAGSILARPGEP